MRQMAIDQKSMVKPQPATAIVQTVKPIPISLKGLTLQIHEKTRKGRE